MAMLRSLALVSALVLCNQLLAQAPPSKPSPGLGQPNTQQDETTKKFEYDPQSQKTGTKSLPLVVQVKPWPQSDVEAADIQKKKDDDSSAKRWGIVMGILSLAIAGGQTYIFKRQLAVFSDQKKLMVRQAQIMHRGLKATVKAANAAKLAADTASIIQLPTLILFKCEVRGEPFKTPLEWLLNPSVATAIHNYGQTPAFVVSWTVGIAYKKVPVGLAGDTPLNEVVKPDTHKWLPVVTPENHIVTATMAEEIRRGDGWYTVNGIVTYDDLFGNRKTIDFCVDLVHRNGKIVITECDGGQPI